MSETDLGAAARARALLRRLAPLHQEGDLEVMSLRSKMLLLLVAATAGCLALAYGALSAFLFPAFGNLQLRIADNDVARANQSIRAVYDTLDAANRDVAEWNSTYEFMQGRGDNYIQDNFNEIFFRNLDLNLMLIFDRQGKLAWGAAWDHESDAFIALDAVLEAPLAPGDPLLVHPDGSGEVHGILRTRRGPMAVDSHPILTSEGDGPVMGSMILGRLLSPDRVRALQQQTRVAFALDSVESARKDRDSSAAVDALLARKEAQLRSEHADDFVTYQLLRDIYGDPAYLLSIRTRRDVAALGLNALQTSLVFLLLTALSFMAVIWLGLQRITLSPIARLESHIRSIRQSGKLSSRIALRRSDEIGRLSSQFDAMTSELERARHEMADARDQAIELARIKSEFLATMSHEIRTPMNGVIGLSDLLLGTNLSVHQRRFASGIQQCADGLLAIINSILDFSKLEAGRVELEQRDFGLRGITEEVALLFASQAHAKGLELACRLPSALDVICRGDANRLRQVLSNLVGNAIKFTDRGEVLIALSIAERHADEVRVRFDVSDTGIGIPKDKQQEIFDSFSQADASTTRRFGGTGLGLAICKQLVVLMGGELSVESALGRGATFSFTLRFTGVQVIADVFSAEVSRLAGKRVLVVDDNATNREILEHELADWNMECVSACGGVEALEALRRAEAGERSFDVALLDLHMPGMDGLELAGRISQRSGSSDFPVVLLSSMQLPGGVEAGERIGICAQLVKPVRRAELLACLLRVVAGVAPSPRTSAEPETRRLRPNIHVLLVEDNPVNQQVAMAMLKQLGCSVSVASDGRQAVAASEHGDCDAILMDCQMPVMDGYRATAEIRRLEAERGGGRHVPIIALTAHVGGEEREKCLEAGMDDHLGKPFKAEVLFEVLAHQLGGIEATRASDRPEPRGEGQEATCDALDRQAIERLRAQSSEGGPDVLANIATAYLESSTALLEELYMSRAAADIDGMLRAAHILRASSQNVGAVALGALCERLEVCGGEADLAAMKDLVDAIALEQSRVENALRSELGTAVGCAPVSRAPLG
jgi:signal transduction histidine kinase/DNA-binding response OmpR family regulator